MGQRRERTAVSDIFEELQWRGLVAQTTDDQALRAALAGGPLTFYCGFDPTAPSLHMGNLVQLILMRHLQRAGHRALCLVGGSTGLIGDPKPTAERTLSSPETVAEWLVRIQAQVQPFLDFGGDNPAIMVNNLDWTAPMSALDFLRDVGKHFRVNAMIKKDAIATRLASQDGISYTEFSYQLLQGMDYLHLYRTYGCTLQTGGNREWHGLARPGDDVAVCLLPVLDQRRGRFGDRLPQDLHRPHPRGDRGARGVAGPDTLQARVTTGPRCRCDDVGPRGTRHVRCAGCQRSAVRQG